MCRSWQLAILLIPSASAAGPHSLFIHSFCLALLLRSMRICVVGVRRRASKQRTTQKNNRNSSPAARRSLASQPVRHVCQAYFCSCGASYSLCLRRLWPHLRCEE